MNITEPPSFHTRWDNPPHFFSGRASRLPPELIVIFLEGALPQVILPRESAEREGMGTALTLFVTPAAKLAVQRK